MNYPEDYHIPLTLKILQSACERHELNIEFIGKDSGHLARVTNGKKSFYSGGAITPTYPINCAVSHDLCADKFYSYKLLEETVIVHPKTQIFFPGFPKFNEYKIDGYGIPEALDFVYSILGYPVIVKPNRGSMGRGVQIVNNDTDLILAMQHTLGYGHACLLQEKIEGDEYRLFCLEGKPRFLYKKARPMIIGDGETPLRDFFRQDLNFEFYNLNFKDLTNGIRQQYQKFLPGTYENDILDGILKLDAVLEVSFLGNIASGAKISNLQLNFAPLHYELAQIVRDKIGVQIYGIDFFALKDPKTFQDIIVIEINGNPSLKGVWQTGQKELCINIWRDIFETYFEKPI